MSLKFTHITDEKQAEAAITNSLKTALKVNQRVLWIVPGGSNIPLTVHIMDNLSGEESANLAIILSDERFGPIDHHDSNLHQMYHAGFNPKKATVIPVLRPGVDLDETINLYGQAAQVAISAAAKVITFLGMGPDGHVAGILPGSPASKNPKAWVVGYETPEFIRLTLTPRALSHTSEAFVVARGDAKRQALEQLKSKSLSLTKQPAQLLKKLPQATIFNDQIGDKL